MTEVASRSDDRMRRTVASAVWAAWADALGFVTELTDEPGLRRRLRGKTLNTPPEWTRRMGGRFGVDVTLPAGCYSDDTQLRLATSRAIGMHGFDVEAFARVELAVWPTYALGGGRATKAAASNLARPSTAWFNNTFDGWVEAGGNGVAMRVQPHVWASPTPATLGQHLLDAIVNGVTTHAHPRALVGAVFHAVALGATLQTGEVPDVDGWTNLLNLTGEAVNLLDGDPNLATLWRPTWEKTTGRSFAQCWQDAIDECRDALAVASDTVEALRRADVKPNDQGSGSGGTAGTIYGKLVAALQLDQPERRGCGTTSAIAALALAAAWPDDPARGAMLAANMLGTDTDTIATMAAAISGATGRASPPPSVLDEDYLAAEARRLATLAVGGRVPTFSYPDLLHWSPPRSQLDAVGLADDRPALAGLGWLRDLPHSDPITHRGSVWRWTQADFGATFLIKRRVKLRPLPTGNYPQRRTQTVASPRPQHSSDRGVRSEQLSFGETVDMAGQVAAAASPPLAADNLDRPHTSRRQRTSSSPHAGVDQVLAWVGGREFSDEAIGYAVRRFAETAGVDQLIAFITALRYELRDRGRNASGTAAAEPSTRFELFQDAKGNYRVRFKSHSGEIIAVGESYASKADALRQIGLITGNATDAAVVDRTNG